MDTGFVSINTWTNGWRKGDLIILASRPAVGKTTFALNLAQQVCEGEGVVNLFTLEMSREQLAKRILSTMTSINGDKWKNPNRLFSEDERTKATQALEVYGRWNFEIHDPHRLTISDIRARVQKTRKEHPNENYLVVIDYLQLITIIGQYDSHALAIFHFTKELKQIAEQYQVPIILVSHLSSDVEERINKCPLLCDLYDADSIDSNADIIMLLYPDAGEGNNMVKIDIAKQWNVRVGMVEFLFDKEVGEFEEVL